jgi:hypothetical protein
MYRYKSKSVCYKKATSVTGQQKCAPLSSGEGLGAAGRSLWRRTGAAGRSLWRRTGAADRSLWRRTGEV